MVYLPFLALLGFAAAVPGIRSPNAAVVPAGSDKAPKGFPMPDIDAITSVPQSSFKSYTTGGLKRLPINATAESGLEKRWVCSTAPTLTWGDADDGGRGVFITNAGNDWRGFYIYHNSCDNIPWKYIWIAAGATQFVSFPALWEGRIVRGVDQSMLSGQSQWLGSWLEVSWDGGDVGWIDVSLIRGCDGAILTWDESDGNKWKGFTQWILDGAPEGAYDMKADGQWVLAATERLDGSINTIPRDWELQKVGFEYVYVDDDHVGAVINGWRFGSYWPEGRA